MITRRTNAIAAVLSVGLTLVIGCGEDKEKNTDTQEAVGSCQSTDDCQANELCLYNLCSPVCEQDSDCAAGAFCTETGTGKACARIQNNGCISSVECPVSMSCVYGRCLSECDPLTGIQCPAGKQCIDGFCQSDVIPTDSDVIDAGTVKSSDENITGNSAPQTAQDAGISSSLCPPGSLQCRENTIVVCDDQGNAKPAQTCTPLCKDGVCIGECKPGDLRCNGNLRQSCDALGQWQSIETCSAICVPEQCLATCVDGSFQCNEATLMSCKNGKLVKEKECPYICKDSKCAGDCVPGDKKCNSSNKAASTCTSESTWDSIDCEHGCTNGLCLTECTPGNKRCMGTSGGRQRCTAQGAWEEAEACENKACVNGECRGNCSPGATVCESDRASFKTCGLNGDWEQAKACEDRTCVEGKCAGECAPYQIKCKKDGDGEDSNVPQTCSNAGKWQDKTACSGDTPICLNGECACSPGKSECSSTEANKYRMCSTAGTWGEYKSCGTNRVCDKNLCKDVDSVCDANDSPHWEINGRNQTLDDPLWLQANVSNFAASYAPEGINFGNYRILIDHASSAGTSGELVVSMRATSTPSDTLGGGDIVYFGIANTNGQKAEAVTMKLSAVSGAGPSAITNVVFYRYTSSGSSGSWSTPTASVPAWLKNADVWANRSNDASWSWGVNFRVNLDAVVKAGVDVNTQINAQAPYRVALGLRVAASSNSTVDLVSPGDIDTLKSPNAASPNKWMHVRPGNNACVANVALTPNAP
jgi:hypothetical protein